MDSSGARHIKRNCACRKKQAFHTHVLFMKEHVVKITFTFGDFAGAFIQRKGKKGTVRQGNNSAAINIKLSDKILYTVFSCMKESAKTFLISTLAHSQHTNVILISGPAL